MELQEFEERALALGIIGLKVTRRGETLVRRLWREDVPRNVYSVSKGFTACAVGFALEEGLLTLDERLTDVFADELPDLVSDHLAQATVRDLLTMCLGQERSFLMQADRKTYAGQDWVRLALREPFPYAPGTHLVYSNVGPYLAGVLVQRRAGCDLTEYLTPRLFAPLDMNPTAWETDPQGNTFGASGLFLTLDELHRFGEFCLQEGAWNGQQLLPVEWMRACTRPQDDPRYGYLFWMNTEGGYRADGKYGQYVIVLPEREAVLIVTAESTQEKLLRHLVAEQLYPQL